LSRSWGRCGPVLGQMWAGPVRMLTDAYPECAHKCPQGSVCAPSGYATRPHIITGDRAVDCRVGQAQRGHNAIKTGLDGRPWAMAEGLDAGTVNRRPRLGMKQNEERNSPRLGVLNARH